MAEQGGIRQSAMLLFEGCTSCADSSVTSILQHQTPAVSLMALHHSTRAIIILPSSSLCSQPSQLPARSGTWLLCSTFPIVTGSWKKATFPFFLQSYGVMNLEAGMNKICTGTRSPVHLGHSEEQQSLTLNQYYSVYHIKKPQMLTESLSSITVSSEPQHTISNWKKIVLYNYKTHDAWVCGSL